MLYRLCSQPPIFSSHHPPEGNSSGPFCVNDVLPISIPFPVPEISHAVEIETNQEYFGVDFAITDSTFKFADYVDETLKVRFLGGLGVLRGIYPSF